MTGWPWEFNAGDGRTLVIGPSEEGTGSGWLKVETEDDPDGPRAYLDGLDIPLVTAKLWEATGALPPVMLGRPDLASARDAGGWVSFGGLRLRESGDGGVSFAMGESTVTLPAGMARQCAAVVVAIADGCRPEPDQAVVEGLAAVIADGGIGLPPREARTLARAILLAGYGREASDDRP